MQGKPISPAVAIGIAAAALILMIAGGVYYMNRPTGPTAEESQNYLKDDEKKPRIMDSDSYK